MKKLLVHAILAICVTTLIQNTLNARAIAKKEVEQQSANFERWWGQELNWKFDELPKAGIVDRVRMPYAGAIYLDRAGGTQRVLSKYDRAFRTRAAAYERYDIRRTQTHTPGRRSSGGGGFLFFRHFSGPSRGSFGTPHWAGHCNGWVAAAIRHAEPQKNVVRNGVTFTPADIKGLMAEMYIYSDTVFLGGVGYSVHPGTLHTVLGNWIGLGKHPIGMDKTLGKEVWNYPIYAYTASTRKRNNYSHEVKVNIGYVKYTEREYQRGPKNHRFLYFHYNLDLDEEGKIVGGSYYRDSNQIDMLWTALAPTQGGTEGNKRGNPHLNVDEVLAMWRESAPERKRKVWYNIDPTDEDRIIDPEAESAEEVAATNEEATETAEATETTEVTETAAVESSEEIVEETETTIEESAVVETVETTAEESVSVDTAEIVTEETIVSTEAIDVVDTIDVISEEVNTVTEETAAPAEESAAVETEEVIEENVSETEPVATETVEEEAEVVTRNLSTREWRSGEVDDDRTDAPPAVGEQTVRRNSSYSNNRSYNGSRSTTRGYRGTHEDLPPRRGGLFRRR